MPAHYPLPWRAGNTARTSGLRNGPDSARRGRNSEGDPTAEAAVVRARIRYSTNPLPLAHFRRTECARQHVPAALGGRESTADTLESRAKGIARSVRARYKARMVSVG